MDLIFAGLVLAHVDAYWHGIDFLPDALAYVLIACGAWQMRPRGGRFVLLTAWSGMTALGAAALLAGRVCGTLPDAGWLGIGVHLLDCALTAVLELVFYLAVRQAERDLQTELDDTMFLPAWALTSLFAVAGAVLRMVENDIFALLTTATTGLMTLWLLYAVWQIRRNTRYVKIQQHFNKNRAH